MTLFFMHITKTAGGSLKELFKTAATEGHDIGFHYPDEPGFRPFFDYKALPEIIFGHYSYGVHERVDAKADYACFLREPISRTISHYHHLKNNDTGNIGKNLRSFESIEQYLKYGRHWEFDNFLTRNLSGVANQTPFGGVSCTIYEKARYNLRCNFRFVGIFEHMQESLRRLQQVLPIRAGNPPEVNIGTYSRETSAEELRMLRALNRFDEMLYEEALDRFERP